MTTIWKFTFGQPDMAFPVPIAAETLAVGLDPHGEVCLWMAVNPAAATETRSFQVVGTGHPIDLSTAEVRSRYIGSVVQDPYVWHVLEHEKENP